MEYKLESVHTNHKLHIQKTFIDPQFSPISPKIKFLISYSFINCVWKLRHENWPHFLLSNAELPLQQATVAVNLNRFHRYNQTYAAIENGIRAWPISPNCRKNFIDGTIRHTLAVLRSLPQIRSDVCVETLFAVVRNLVVRPLQPIHHGREVPPAASCSVCLEEFGEAWERVYIPCSHVFHQDCIQKWLRINNSCPLCRFDVAKKFEFIIQF